MPENQRVCVQLESALMVLVSCLVQCQEFCETNAITLLGFKLHCERPMVRKNNAHLNMEAARMSGVFGERNLKDIFTK